MRCLLFVEASGTQCVCQGRKLSDRKNQEFSSAISKTLDLNEILDKTISVMKELMDVGNIYICMQDAPGQPYREWQVISH